MNKWEAIMKNEKQKEYDEILDQLNLEEIRTSIVLTDEKIYKSLMDFDNALDLQDAKDIYENWVKGFDDTITCDLEDKDYYEGSLEALADDSSPGAAQ